MLNYFNSKIYKIVCESKKQMIIGCTTQKDLDKRLLMCKYYSRKIGRFRNFYNNKDLKIFLIEKIKCHYVEDLKNRMDEIIDKYIKHSQYEILLKKKINEKEIFKKNMYVCFKISITE